MSIQERTGFGMKKGERTWFAWQVFFPIQVESCRRWCHSILSLGETGRCTQKCMVQIFWLAHIACSAICLQVWLLPSRLGWHLVHAQTHWDQKHNLPKPNTIHHPHPVSFLFRAQEACMKLAKLPCPEIAHCCSNKMSWLDMMPIGCYAAPCNHQWINQSPLT